MKLGGNAAFCLPMTGRRTQLFHLIFTQPGAHLLVHPCTDPIGATLQFDDSIPVGPTSASASGERAEADRGAATAGIDDAAVSFSLFL